MFAEKFLCGEFLSVDGDDISMPLKAVSVNGTVDDILTTFTIRQTYNNDSDEPIQAIYSFPIPPNAVLLGMEAQFGEHKLLSMVQQPGEAYAEYKVLEAGEGPVLLQKDEFDLFRAKFGKVKPGESAIIEYRYALQHTWDERVMRVEIPTIIAPRYLEVTTPERADSRPAYADEALPQWQFTLDVTGTLAQCAIKSSSSQPLTITPASHGLQVGFDTLPEHDCVLEFESDTRIEALAVCDRDKDGWIVAADFMPYIQDSGRGSVNLDILVDCSGTISETSMQQVREGLRLILDDLGPNDFFNITMYGRGKHKSLFSERRPAEQNNLSQAKKFANNLPAKVWGRHDGAVGLNHVYTIPGGKGPRSILIISDGLLADSLYLSKDELFEDARTSGCRIMAVQVGWTEKEKRDEFYSPFAGNTARQSETYSKKLMNNLALMTGGKCLCVSHDEDMAHRIHEHCMSIARLATTDLRIVAEGADDVKGLIPSAFYNGDTLSVFVHYADRPSGEIRLQATANGESHTWTCAIPEPSAMVPESPCPSDLARTVAAIPLWKLEGMETNLVHNISLDYQLFSTWTKYFLVENRAYNETGDGKPANVTIWFEPILFDSNESKISGGEIVMIDMNGVIKHCIADDFKNSKKTVDLWDIESTGEGGDRAISVPRNSYIEFLDDDSIIFHEVKCAPFRCQYVGDPVIRDRTRLDKMRVWIRSFVHGHTQEESLAAKLNIVHILNEAEFDFWGMREEQKRRGSMHISSIFHDYIEGNSPYVERYYDLIERHLLPLNGELKLKYMEEACIVLADNMRLKVVVEHHRDDENDIVSYTLMDPYSGEVTHGKGSTSGEYIGFWNLRYFCRDNRPNNNERSLLVDFAECIYNCQLMFGNQSRPSVQLMASTVATNLYKVAHKKWNSHYTFLTQEAGLPEDDEWLKKIKDEEPHYHKFLEAFTDAFTQIYERDARGSAEQPANHEATRRTL